MSIIVNIMKYMSQNNADIHNPNNELTEIRKERIYSKVNVMKQEHMCKKKPKPILNWCIQNYYFCLFLHSNLNLAKIDKKCNFTFKLHF